MNHKTMKPPVEMIVVEGRDDTKRLIETFGNDVKTIETNGSAIDQAKLKQIEQANSHFGVIVFTDPDFQGERLRRIITEAVPTAKHAYLTPEETAPTKEGKSVGIEHASKEAIFQAIEGVMSGQLEAEYNYLPMSVLMELKLAAHPEASKRRAYLTRKLRIGHINAKQLQKRLAFYNIGLEALKDLLKEGEKNDFHT